MDSTFETCGIPCRMSSTCLTTCARARNGGAVRQLHGDEEGALVLLRQEARRAYSATGRTMPPRSRRISTTEIDREPHQPAHHRRIAVAHLVDAAPDTAHDPAPLAVWRRNTPHSAGDSVSALIAEITIATLMVTANWRNNWPEMPGMKPIGTNTDSSTSVMAMIGPVIWRIAFLVASLGERSGSSSITRSTFSTTTMASSTTMPIASTIASSDTVLAE